MDVPLRPGAILPPCHRWSRLLRRDSRQQASSQIQVSYNTLDRLLVVRIPSRVLACRMSKQDQCTQTRKRWDGNVSGLKRLGQGGTAFVFAIDQERVVKVPAGFDMSIRAVDRERAVFKRLNEVRPSCRHVLLCLELWCPRGLVLERCVETVRECVQNYERGVQSRVVSGEVHIVHRWERQKVMDQSMKWAYQAAKGISFLHGKGIVHADVGCHNLLLDADRNVKVADFSGSVILHGPEEYTSALVCYDARSRKPGVSAATEQTDIFALGSVVYELATGHLPYAELQDFQVAYCFEKQNWPKNLESIMSLQPIIEGTIRGCWEGHFEHAEDVALKIKPDEILESPLPGVEADDTDSSFVPSMYTGTTFCSEDSRNTNVSSEKPRPEPKPRSSEKRSHPRRRKRTEKKTEKNLSLFEKFLSCFGKGRTLSASDRKARYLSR